MTDKLTDEQMQEALHHAEFALSDEYVREGDAPPWEMDPYKLVSRALITTSDQLAELRRQNEELRAAVSMEGI